MSLTVRWQWSLYAAVGALFFLLGFFLFSHSSSDGNGGGIGGRFVLQDGGGGEVTERIFADKPYAMMFGFTHCPDICPTGLSRMRSWQALLGERQDDLRYAFVTVDPERDTPAVLARYVAYFSDAIIPLSGTPPQIKEMLKKYGVFAQKVPLGGDNYTIDHHSAVFLFDAAGDFVEFIYYDDNREEAMRKIKQLLGY